MNLLNRMSMYRFAFVAGLILTAFAHACNY